MIPDPPDETIDLPTLIGDGFVIAAILVFWGALSLVGIGIANVGDTGSYLVPLGEALSQLFIGVGLASVLLYVVARGIKLSRS